MTRIVLMAGLILVLVLGASIGYFNAQPVSFDYLLGVWEIPLIAVLIAAFSAGVVLTLLVVAGRILSLRLEVRRMTRQIREHEIELRNLRNLPVTAESTGTGKS
ncbi:MAG: LapA family protein [Sinimarinibacterium sp.]|jgi:uncharacterized integral membrane protein